MALYRKVNSSRTEAYTAASGVCEDVIRRRLAMGRIAPLYARAEKTETGTGGASRSHLFVCIIADMETDPHLKALRGAWSVGYASHVTPRGTR